MDFYRFREGYLAAEDSYTEGTAKPLAEVRPSKMATRRAHDAESAAQSG